MTTNEVKNLKVGSKIIDVLGDILIVTNISDNWYELKWEKENNTLSKGSLFKVPSHFDRDRLLRL